MTLKGEKVSIRPITRDDTDMVLSWRNSDLVKQFFIYRKDITREEHLSWFENKIEKGAVVQFIIEAEEGPVGSVYIQNINKTHRNGEYGIFIGEPNALGKGYGTDAGRLILKYAFETLNLHKVYLRVIDNNIRAIKSYEKLGFSVDGVLKDDVCIDGEFRDIVIMSVLKGQEK
jgi:UDP-4-amino-4,6-dideoxy-N-acetyl-beta-L-altrosamine N-acetyltransferase